MEYSLQTLNENSNLKSLTTTEIIDQLNLIGFEVDETFNETFITNKFLDNLRLLIKIPANREDLLAERFLLAELSTIFLFDVNHIWKKIKQNYYTILSDKYFEFSDYESTVIHSENIKKKRDTEDIFAPFHIFTVEIELNSTFSTPLWIQNKLLNAGLKSTNTIHDLIELNNLEWGQSINYLSTKRTGFDLFIDRLDVKTVYFDKSRIEYNLTPGTVVIKNSHNEIESVLGIFNQLEKSETNQNKIILQSIFYNIHENPLLLNPLENKISLRYLRSLSLRNFRSSFERLLTLLEVTSGAKIIPSVYVTRKSEKKLKPYRKVILQKLLLKNTLNINQIDLAIFKQAGLVLCKETKETLTFIIPSQRNDLIREIDIIEEYSRFVGYKNFIPIAPQKVKKYFPTQAKNSNFLKQILLSKGFQEIITNPLRDITKQTKNSIVIKNPLNNEFHFLRMTLLEKIIDVFEINLRLRNNPTNCFEIGRVFDKLERDGFKERENIAGIFQLGRFKKGEKPTTEWFIAKGFIENLLAHFGYKKIQFEKLTDKNSLFHPTKSVIVKWNENTLGVFGEINPAIENFKSLKFSTYIFEFSMEFLTKSRMVSAIPTFQDFSKYPMIIKDLSFVISKEENFHQLKMEVENTSSFLKKVEFFDIYFDDTSFNTINVGIRLDFQPAEENFTTEFIENELTRIKTVLVADFQAEFKN
jgi:phenylalanyl-tRNA synthetase beta chain